MITAGIDVGASYTKGLLVDDRGIVLAQAMRPTGFKLTQVAREVFDTCLGQAGLNEAGCSYVIATGVGRYQCDFKDLTVTELTAGARGALHVFPATRTVLDIGGQTMKASRLGDSKRVEAFRMNDKCAAGTGAFLEKTARYMGYSTEEICSLLDTSRQAVPISGVCAVFAESEVINHLSLGTSPGDIMQGAIESLTKRSVQLMKRIKGKPEYTLIGGILRFSSMQRTVEDQLRAAVNVPSDADCQFACALGAGLLGHIRLAKLKTEGSNRVQPGL
jgi:predicted CoA-substrate-specific enzyme activase